MAKNYKNAQLKWMLEVTEELVRQESLKVTLEHPHEYQGFTHDVWLQHHCASETREPKLREYYVIIQSNLGDKHIRAMIDRQMFVNYRNAKQLARVIGRTLFYHYHELYNYDPNTHQGIKRDGVQVSP